MLTNDQPEPDHLVHIRGVERTSKGYGSEENCRELHFCSSKIWATDSGLLEKLDHPQVMVV